MKNPTIDLIQVFCANFKCDLDLSQPPGLPRYIGEVKWPNFEDFNIFRSLDDYSRKVKIRELEILLKRSRYSIETIQLVLSDRASVPHLKSAILNHYMETSIKDNFHADKMIVALRALELIPEDINEVESIANAEKKFSDWLLAASNKCKK
jgi:hypothetical protein